MAKRRNSKHSSSSQKRSTRPFMLEAAKRQAGELVEQGRPEDVLELLEPFAASYPNDTELQLLLGMGYFSTGEIETAVDYYERAYAGGENLAVLYPLGMAYWELGMIGSALHAFDEAAQSGLPPLEEMDLVVAELRNDLNRLARRIGQPVDNIGAGLRPMEQGFRLVARGDFTHAIDAFRAGIQQLGDWPPVYSPFVNALFGDGQTAAAITECRQFLARQPGDPQMTSNLIRFLVWTGERAAAEAIWQPLSMRNPGDLPVDTIVMAQAAAALDDDENVHRLLQPLADLPPEAVGGHAPYIEVQRFLATAAANLGDREAAIARLEPLRDEDEHCDAICEALEQGQMGLGLLPRFAYYSSTHLIPIRVFEQLIDLIEATLDDDDPKSERDLRQLIAHYPQLVQVLEKAIWEDDDVELGLIGLRFVATPAAHAALRHFAGSEAGSYEARIHALADLQFSGGALPGERFDIWCNDAWHAVPLRNVTVNQRPPHVPHSQKVKQLMASANTAVEHGKFPKAADLLRKAIALEPGAYDAINNLAVLLAALDDKATSTTLLEPVLTLKPLFVNARVQLALNMLPQDPPAATAYLQPLEAVTDFYPQEYAAYQYALASVALHSLDSLAARDALTIALYVDPTYIPAMEGLALLGEIEAAGNEFESGWDPFMDD